MGQKSKSFDYQISLAYFLWLDTLKGTAKATAVDLFEVQNTPRETKTALPGAPHSFYMGVFLGSKNCPTV